MAERTTKLRVFVLGADGRVVDVSKAFRSGSKQLKGDPFLSLYGELGLMTPPYDFDQLMDLRELCPVHSAAIEQKALDITGLGWDLVQREDVKNPSEEQYRQIKAFLDDPNPEMTMTELQELVWLDVETLAWGMFEVIHDQAGRPAELYHVPAHTVRAHSDGVRFVQIRPPGGTSTEYRRVWFKRFNARDADGKPLHFDSHTGQLVPADWPQEKQANEVLVIRRATSRSSYYGIPGYVSSLGAISALRAVQDFNLSFFDNWAIPANLVVLQGAGLPDDLEPTLTRVFKESYRRKTDDASFQSFKTLVLPLPYGDVKAEVLQLKSPEEAGFQEYMEALKQEVLVAHRVPPYRLGWAIMGSLGGTTARETLGVYKDAVVERGQTVLEHRFNRFLKEGFANGKELDWEWKLADIDLSDREADRRHWLDLVRFGVATPNEARVALGIGEAEDNPDGDRFLVDRGLMPLEQVGESLLTMEKQEESVPLALRDLEQRLEAKLAELHNGNFREWLMQLQSKKR